MASNLALVLVAGEGGVGEVMAGQSVAAALELARRAGDVKTSRKCVFPSRARACVCTCASSCGIVPRVSLIRVRSTDVQCFVSVWRACARSAIVWGVVMIVSLC